MFAVYIIAIEDTSDALETLMNNGVIEWDKVEGNLETEQEAVDVMNSLA